MSETPEPEHLTGAPPPPPPQTAPSQQPPVPTRPANVKPVYRRRSFQLAAVGVVGLLLGCLIGLGIGLVSGLVVGGHHGRDDIGRHQWGPGDGYRQPDRKRLPGAPFAPPRQNQPNPASPSAVSPSPQTS